MLGSLYHGKGARYHIELSQYQDRPGPDLGSQENQLQRRLSKAWFDMGAKPDISEVAWNSQAAEPLVRFMTAYLLKLEPFFLRTILENLRLSREGARMLSVVELVESVAQILKDNGNRELSIDIMIQQFSEKSNRPHPGHEQGLFALFGSLTMLYRISHPIDPRFILLRKPKTPWMTRSRRKTNEARLPIGILVGCFGRYTSEVMKFLSEELEPKPAENEAIDLYDSPLNIYVLIVIGRVNIHWSNLLSAHLSFDRYLRTLTLFRFAHSVH